MITPTKNQKKVRIKETLNSNYAGMTFIPKTESEDRYFISAKISFLKSDCEILNK